MVGICSSKNMPTIIGLSCYTRLLQTHATFDNPMWANQKFYVENFYTRLEFLFWVSLLSSPEPEFFFWSFLLFWDLHYRRFPFWCCRQCLVTWFAKKLVKKDMEDGRLPGDLQFMWRRRTPPPHHLISLRSKCSTTATSLVCFFHEVSMRVCAFTGLYGILDLKLHHLYFPLAFSEGSATWP